MFAVSTISCNNIEVWKSSTATCIDRLLHIFVSGVVVAQIYLGTHDPRPQLKCKDVWQVCPHTPVNVSPCDCSPVSCCLVTTQMHGRWYYMNENNVTVMSGAQPDMPEIKCSFEHLALCKILFDLCIPRPRNQPDQYRKAISQQVTD